MSEKSSTKAETEMAALADEMHDAIVSLAGERGWSETREAWIARAARRAGISVRAAKSFFYKEAANPAALTVERVRIARGHHDKPADLARRLRARLDELDATRNALAAELARVASDESASSRAD